MSNPLLDYVCDGPKGARPVQPTYQQKGPVRFSRCLGKTLRGCGDELWSDLTERLGVRKLAVIIVASYFVELDYCPAEPMSAAVVLKWDYDAEDYIVEDVLYQPWYS